MEAKLFDQKGKEIGTVALNDAVFGLEVNEGLIHRALLMQLSNARNPIAHSKTRSERRGSTRKLFKQKGTGNARAGSARSPIRKKGGVVFGPRNNRNYTVEMNKKERRKALFCALSAKAKANQIIIIDELNLKQIKTKELITIFSNLPYEKNIVLALAGKNEVIEKSGANIPFVKTIMVDYLNIADLLKYKTLVFLQDGLEKVNALASK